MRDLANYVIINSLYVDSTCHVTRYGRTKRLLFIYLIILSSIAKSQIILLYSWQLKVL